MNTVDESLKEIELQRMVLENLGITSEQIDNDIDRHIRYLVESVMNTCFMPSDFTLIHRFKYENQVVGSSKLYLHDTGDCVVVIDIEKNLPTEVIKQLLLLRYKPEGTGWIAYKRRVY